VYTKSVVIWSSGCEASRKLGTLFDSALGMDVLWYLSNRRRASFICQKTQPDINCGGPPRETAVECNKGIVGNISTREVVALSRVGAGWGGGNALNAFILRSSV
jgi:hypothetical protein